MVKRVVQHDDSQGRSSHRGAAGAGSDESQLDEGSQGEPLALTDQRAGQALGQGVKQAGRALSAGIDAISDDAGGIATAVAIGVGAALLEAELIPGILIGAGAVLLGKMFPQVRSAVRPMVKGVVGAGLAMADKAREMVAEANEQVQDMVAEVRSERGEQRTATGSQRQTAAGQREPHEPQERTAHGNDAADTAAVH
jgi:hypothetical protein